MSPASVTPFLADASDLFPPSAFDAPPVNRPPPEPPADWISFPPPDGPSSFEAFRRSPLFERARAQILDRTADCEAFTRAHFSQREAEQMLDGFQGFRHHLTHEDGDAFFTQGLPTLYGYGKRHFDGFCLRLAQDDLDLDQRKTALRELAHQLHFCGSSGPAFLNAYLMLDRAQGGLHSEFHDALLMRMDALLTAFVNQDPPGSDPSPEAVLARQNWRRQMEVHMVNRLKLELGLPGGNPADRFSFGTNIHHPEQVPRCKAFLKQHLRPTVLARDLAERYVARLREALPAPLREPDADLSDATDLIRPVHTRLNATFGPVALHHLLAEDEATGQTRWHSDVALVALDVLDALEELGLVVRPTPIALMHSIAQDCHWELLHVDWQLFFIQERWPPATEAAPVPVPVQLRHLQRGVETSPGRSPFRPLVDAVLRSEPPARLMEIPPQWLTTQDQMRTQLQTLGSPRTVDWLARHGAEELPESVLERLLPTLTELGMSEALGKLMTPGHRFAPRDWLTLAGGVDVLHRSLRGSLHQSVQPGRAACSSLWCSVLDAARSTLSGSDLQRAFLVPGQPSLVTLALLGDSDVLLQPLLGLLVEARRHQKIDNETLIRLMEVPIQHAMAQGVAASLMAYGSSLAQMARAGWLRSPALRRLLEGPVRGAGCGSAMAAGQTRVVTWWHQYVAQLHQARWLSSSDAGSLAAGEGTPGDDSAAMKAVRSGRPRSLSVHLKALLTHARTGLLPTDWLPRLLACSGGDGASALGLMLQALGHHPCLGPWRAAVAQATQDLSLNRAALCELLAAPDAAGTPFLRDLVRRSGTYDRAVEWLETVKYFHALNRIQEAQVVQLLEARGPARLGQHESALHAAMTTWTLPHAVSFFFTLFGRASALQLVSDTALGQLLNASRSDDPSISALAAAVDLQQTLRLREYLTELLWLFQHPPVAAPVRWRLLDGRLGDGPSALARAVRGGQAWAVRALLKASLQAAEQGLISGEDWCQTLLPTRAVSRRSLPMAGTGRAGDLVDARADPGGGADSGGGAGDGAGASHGSGALDALRPRPDGAGPDPEILQAFEHALTMASTRGLLAGPRGTEVLQRWRDARPSVDPSDLAADTADREEGDTEGLETTDGLTIEAVDSDMDDENVPPRTPPPSPTQA